MAVRPRDHRLWELLRLITVCFLAELQKMNSPAVGRCSYHKAEGVNLLCRPNTIDTCILLALVKPGISWRDASHGKTHVWVACSHDVAPYNRVMKKPAITQTPFCWELILATLPSWFPQTHVAALAWPVAVWVGWSLIEPPTIVSMQWPHACRRHDASTRWCNYQQTTTTSKLWMNKTALIEICRRLVPEVRLLARMDGLPTVVVAIGLHQPTDRLCWAVAVGL